MARKDATKVHLKERAKARAEKWAKALENKAMAKGQARSLEIAIIVDHMDTRQWIVHSLGKVEDSTW